MVEALVDTDRPRQYWADLKRKLSDLEGFSEVYEKIVQLKLPATDGKLYETDTANTETVFRIIQSIPSPKAERFKRWLAKVGYERIQEFQDPEISVKRAIANWQIQGRTDDWIEARLRSIVARNDLTSEWARRGVREGIEYATLTNVISEETFGIDTQQHKKVKGLRSQNLRDHMTDLELIFTMLGEKSTTAIAQASHAYGFEDNRDAATKGGQVAGDARRGLEARTGKKVVSSSNFLNSQRQADPRKLTHK